MAAPTPASADCSGTTYRPYDLTPNRCPTVDDCIVIDESFPASSVTLPASCSYVGVQFRIERSDFTFDCSDVTLDGSKTPGNPVAIEVYSERVIKRLGEPVGCLEIAPADAPVCSVDRPGVSNVVVQNCQIRGYDKGVSIKVGRASGSDNLGLEELFLEYYDHPTERECRTEPIEDCLREAAPHNITIENVDATLQGNVGIYVEQYAHDVTVRRSSMTWSRSGPGLYLAPGSRDNLIENNTISDNWREGIAIDASAGNEISGNEIEENGRRAYDGWYHSEEIYEAFRIGITIFRNTWENRWAEAQQSPRHQHARANLIAKNSIIGHRTGVYVGFRQQSSDGAPLDPGSDGDPIYYHADGGGYYHRQFAEDTAIVGNAFRTNARGVRVFGDDTTISGNTFQGGTTADIDIGSDVREHAGEPIHNTVITGNVFTPGLAHAIWQRECAVDTQIANNSTDVPITEACKFPRARLLGHVVGTSGNYSLDLQTRVGPVLGNDTWLAGDFDGNGRRNDVVHIFYSPDGRARVWVHLGGERAFTYESSFQTFDFTGIAKDGQWIAGQFDGQPGDDLIYVEGSGTTSTCFRGWAGVGAGFQPGFRGCRYLNSVPYAPHHRWLVGDFSRDGQDDLIEIHGTIGSTSKIVPHARTSAFRFGTASTLAVGVMDPNHRWLVGDWDADGRADLARIFANSNGEATAWVQLSNGSGFAAMSWLSTLGGAGFWSGQNWLASNFDGDDDDDIVLVYGNAGNARAWRHRSTGSGFSSAGIQTIGAFADNQRYLAAHLDANASEDLIVVGEVKWYP